MTVSITARIVPGMALEVTSLRWPPETFARLKAIAESEKTTVSDLIRGATLAKYPEPENGKAPAGTEALSQTNEGVS